MREFRIAGRKQTVSRVAVLTGLSRKDVLRLQRLDETADADRQRSPHRVERVVSGWVRDEEFLDATGQPALLPVAGEGASFETLVHRYSGDMTPRAVLDELIRTEVVNHAADDRVELLKRAYIPGGDEVEKLPLLGSDVRDLATTIDHNLSASPGEAWLQRTVSYDNLPEEYVRQLRLLITRNGEQLMERWDSELARHDRDVTPAAGGDGRMRVAIGIYYLEEHHSTYSEEQDS
jgi:hypothetical protein